MSVNIWRKVWSHPPQRQGQLLVMLALADYANDAGMCWPSVKALAAKVRMTERGCQRVLRTLAVDKHLTVDTGKGRGGCNIYRLHPDPRYTPTLGTPPTVDTPTPRPSIPNTPTLDTPEPSLTTNEPTFCSLPRDEPPPAAGLPADDARRAEPPPPTETTKRKTGLPEGWTLPAEGEAFARSRNLNEERITREADQFRDYYLSRGGQFKDWSAVWRSWVRKCNEFDSGSRVVGRSGGRGGERGGGIAGAAARRACAG